MKLSEIEFKDNALKACVFATGEENAEDIVELRCRKQDIESLAGIEHLVNLKLLDLTRNDLTTVDLSKNTLLEEVFLGNNEISSLDISGCRKLTHLEVFINELDELDVSNNTLLEEIYANKNELGSVDLSKNTELVDLRLSHNEIAEIDLSANDKLEMLELEKNPLIDSTRSMISQLKNAEVHI